MKIIGAVAKSNCDDILYFTDFDDTDAQRTEIGEMLKKQSDYKETFGGSCIRAVAYISNDNMESNRFVVGIIIQVKDSHITITLNDYSEVKQYLNELMFLYED